MLEDVRYITTSDGARLAVTEIVRGAPKDGPRFLLIHGFAQNRLAFTLGPLPDLLIDRGARVFVGELRGHGRSRGHQVPRHPLETHLQIDLPEIIEQIGAPVHLIGHSMGGYLGYAMLSRSRPAGPARAEPSHPSPLASRSACPLSSLTTFGAPVLVGRGRYLLKLASILAGPLGEALPGAVPMDHFLRLLSSMLAEPDARGVTRAVQLITRLASPKHAHPEAIAAILANADPASPRVFVELARMTLVKEPKICGVRLVDALMRAEIPVATVVGSNDVFGGRLGAAPFDLPDQAGPRLVVEVPGGTHVDITIGHHLPETVERLWPFLMEGR